MDKELDIFIKSVKMCIENDMAWLVAWEDNDLYSYNMQTKQCEYLVSLPENETHPICVKYQNDVYCLPDKGNEIIIYNLVSKKKESILVNNPNKERLLMMNYCREGDRLWTIARGTKQVIEINLSKRKIEKYYSIFDRNEERIGQQITKIGNYIYCPSRTSNRICEFCITTGKSRYYEIDEMDGGINTIFFDGFFFWLSGCRKRICIWKKEENYVKTLGRFPKGFIINGIEKAEHVFGMPIFCDSAGTEEYVWFFPANFVETRCNSIIYVNKKNYSIGIFEWNRNSREGDCFLEYVLNERYIAVCYPDEYCITEIDADSMKANKKRMTSSINMINTALKDKLEHRESINENGTFKLSFFLNTLCTNMQGKNPELHNNMEKAIWDESKKGK